MYSLYITVRLVTRLWDGRSAVRILAELLSKPSKPALGQTQYPIHLLIGSTVDQRSGKWQSKNVTIFVGIIIYQLHVSALIGHLQVGIQRQRKISIVSIGMGGQISFTNIWDLWSNRCWSKHVFAWCVHQLGSRGWVLKHWWPGVTMVG